MNPVGHFRSNLHTAGDGARMHNTYLFFGPLDAFGIYAKKLSILTDGWKGGSLVAFKLDAQDIDYVQFFKHAIQIVRYLNPQFGYIRRDERCRADDKYSGPKFSEAPYIRAGHPRMQNITHNPYGKAFNSAKMLFYSEYVQKTLGGMLVAAIAGIYYRSRKGAGQMLRRSRDAVTHHHDVYTHSLNISGRIL